MLFFISFFIYSALALYHYLSPALIVFFSSPFLHFLSFLISSSVLPLSLYPPTSGSTERSSELLTQSGIELKSKIFPGPKQVSKKLNFKKYVVMLMEITFHLSTLLLLFYFISYIFYFFFFILLISVFIFFLYFRRKRKPSLNIQQNTTFLSWIKNHKLETVKLGTVNWEP